MKTIVVFVVLGLSLLLAGVTPADAVGETPTAQEIIAASIAYHDPHGVWGHGEVQLGIRTTYSDELATRSGSREASVQLWLSPGQEMFRSAKEVGEDVIEYRLNGNDGIVTVNGKADISGADRERLRVGEPTLYRDYFEYLYGMPMKLRDPGTRVEPGANATRFNGHDVWALRVTYDAEVGKDIWYFYFDRRTFALTGYRFFHDETVNDGEYIAFEGEIRDAETGLRIPKRRVWYYNADDKHLATDDVISLGVQMEGDY